MRLIFAFLLLVSLGTHGQKTIQANVENGKPYIEYTVGGGETLFSISRKFNVPLSDIETFNKRSLKGPELKKDETIRIPLIKTNFSINTCNTCEKVYYKVQPHEGLYRVGINFGNAGMASIKKINNLSSDNISIGQILLVGYLKVTNEKNNTSSNTNNKGEKEVIATVEEKTKPIEQEDQVKQQKEIKQTEEQQAYDIKEQEVKEETPTHADSNKNTFESQYNSKTSSNSTSGVAAIFKSTSGWNDGKYYVLMSNIAPGTIVKITATTNNNSIYAKVLGELPEIKQNEGLTLRISNAAAAALNGGEENIQVTVNY